jgi:ribonuclease D
VSHLRAIRPASVDRLYPDYLSLLRRALADPRGASRRCHALQRRRPLPYRILGSLTNEAWNEFTATSPEGIDYVAEASVRGLMVARIRRAITRGEADRRVLRQSALNGL